MGERTFESIFVSHGLACAVVATDMGHRCGYVRLPNDDHPWFGWSYGLVESDARLQGCVHVHGGLTFAGDLTNDGAWWLGFDCGHSFDGRDPSIMSEERKQLWSCSGMRALSGGTIRKRPYVMRECMLLAEQIAMVA